MDSPIFQIISSNNYGYIIVTDAATKVLKCDCHDRYIDNVFLDARAACFYALGLSQLSGKPSCLIILDDEIPSVHTALTEIVFQNQEVLVVAIMSGYVNYHDENIRKTRINVRACTVQNMSNVIASISGSRKPGMIFLNGLIENDDLLTSPRCFVNLKIFGDIYADYAHLMDETILVGSNCGYGVVSKYLGYLAGGNKGLLITEYSNFIKDISVLINYKKLRNITPHIILCNSENIEKLRWVEEQGFTLFELNGQMALEKSDFLKCQSASILLYER